MRWVWTSGSGARGKLRLEMGTGEASGTSGGAGGDGRDGSVEGMSRGPEQSTSTEWAEKEETEGKPGNGVPRSPGRRVS